MAVSVGVTGVPVGVLVAVSVGVTGVPVGVGFGIRDAATAARIATFADAVVVGSRIIEEIEKSTAGGDATRVCANVKALVADIRHGVDEVKK